jgi:hypothetical protein
MALVQSSDLTSTFAEAAIFDTSAARNYVNLTVAYSIARKQSPRDLK